MSSIMISFDSENPHDAVAMVTAFARSYGQEQPRPMAAAAPQAEPAKPAVMAGPTEAQVDAATEAVRALFSDGHLPSALESLFGKGPSAKAQAVVLPCGCSLTFREIAEAALAAAR